MDSVQAMEIVAMMLGVHPLSATRQTFGHSSVTYDVALPARNVILRTNARLDAFATTERNLAILSGLGLPVPKVIASDLTLARYPFSWMLMERIPGRDLNYELRGMTRQQMTRLAEQIVGFQKQVGLLPLGAGYGFVGIGETGPHASWWKLVLHEECATLPSHAESDVEWWQARVLERIHDSEAYLRAVPATCFLDDVTVKNVIVQDGQLQGLVDFDCVCYGDPLYWLALTAVGVVSGPGTRCLFYIKELKRLWRMTAEQERALALYSAAIALDFLRRFAAAETSEWDGRMWAAVIRWMAATDRGR